MKPCRSEPRSKRGPFVLVFALSLAACNEDEPPRPDADTCHDHVDDCQESNESCVTTNESQGPICRMGCQADTDCPKEYFCTDRFRAEGPTDDTNLVSVCIAYAEGF